MPGGLEPPGIIYFSVLEKQEKRRFFCYFLRRAKSNQKARARTRQKLPVASFGVSETAETGSIVSGREQDDHVSRRLSLNIQILTLVG